MDFLFNILDFNDFLLPIYMLWRPINWVFFFWTSLFLFHYPVVKIQFFCTNSRPFFYFWCFMICETSQAVSSDGYFVKIGKFFRGNTPFCSKECRQEQIEIDEAKDKNWKLSSSNRGLRKSDPNKNSTPSKTVQTGTLVVAWPDLQFKEYKSQLFKRKQKKNEENEKGETEIFPCYGGFERWDWGGGSVICKKEIRIWEFFFYFLLVVGCLLEVFWKGGFV